MKTKKKNEAAKDSLEQLHEIFLIEYPIMTDPLNTDDFSLEQPSFLKWVPSETTYGIDVSV